MVIRPSEEQINQATRTLYLETLMNLQIYNVLSLKKILIQKMKLHKLLIADIYFAKTLFLDGLLLVCIVLYADMIYEPIQNLQALQLQNL